MEQDPQKLLELAGEVWDAERKYGLIGRAASRIFSRKGKNQPVEAIDYRQAVVKAALENAVDKIASQDLTVEQAFQIVGRVVTFDDLAALNSTWQNHWSESASKVGIDDEERRTWWARLLAGEIQQTGTFSLRTMAVMETLSTEEARLFTRLCSYVWNPSRPVLILPSDDSSLWKPDVNEAAILESIGLIQVDLMSGYRWAITNDEAKDMIRKGHSIPMRMEINRKVFQVLSNKDNIADLRCGKFLLTNVGVEMYRLTSPEYSESYCNEIVAEWQKSYDVNQVPIVSTQGP